MYAHMFELYDVFFVKSLKASSSSFCIADYISFTHSNTEVQLPESSNIHSHLITLICKEFSF